MAGGRGRDALRRAVHGRDQEKALTPEAMREAVVTQQRAPKMDAPTGKLAGARQKTTNARIVSVPSVRPPR